MRYKEKIIAYFDGCPKGNVVSANELYESEFSRMSQAAFFKALERLVNEGVLVRAAKGMYAKKSDIESDDVLNHFFGEDNMDGMYIGERLYAKYGLTTAESRDIWLYSTLIVKETCNIGKIHVKRVPVELNYDNTKIIEALEILQNYDKIENLNKDKFARYARQFAKGYNDASAVNVINAMKYKKSTIAFMKRILDMYKVPNTLQQFLSYASRYKVPTVARVAR
jgi:hypothetical protein